MNIEEIRHLKNSGLSYSEIARSLNVSRQCIWIRLNKYSSSACKNNIIKLKYKNLKKNSDCEMKIKCNGFNFIEDLVIHHKDFNEKNDCYNNLSVLCKKCHSYFHALNKTDKIVFKKHEKSGIIAEHMKYYDDILCENLTRKTSMLY